MIVHFIFYSFACLKKVEPHLEGNYLFLRFVASTGDAMGMNMVLTHFCYLLFSNILILFSGHQRHWQGLGFDSVGVSASDPPLNQWQFLCRQKTQCTQLDRRTRQIRCG